MMFDAGAAETGAEAAADILRCKLCRQYVMVTVADCVFPFWFRLRRLGDMVDSGDWVMKIYLFCKSL